MKLIKQVSLIIILIAACLNAGAQNLKSGASKNPLKKYPSSFAISKTDFDNLFTYKTNELIRTKTNKYLDKSVLMANALNGDTKFLKIKLVFFARAFLTVQVNGEYSTQVFVLSEDKSVFYKGRLEKGNFTMTKCNEDDIVSE